MNGTLLLLHVITVYVSVAVDHIGAIYQITITKILTINFIITYFLMIIITNFTLFKNYT